MSLNRSEKQGVLFNKRFSEDESSAGEINSSTQNQRLNKDKPYSVDEYIAQIKKYQGSSFNVGRTLRFTWNSLVDNFSFEQAENAEKEKDDSDSWGNAKLVWNKFLKKISFEENEKDRDRWGTYKLIKDAILETFGWDTVNHKLRDFSQVLYGAGGQVDVVTTGPRTWQVYSAVLVRKTNESGPTRDSSYYRELYVDDCGSKLTTAGEAVLGLGVASIVTGFAVESFNNGKMLYGKSLDELRKKERDQLNYFYENDEAFHADIDSTYKRLLRRRKIVDRGAVAYNWRTFIDADGFEKSTSDYIGKEYKAHDAWEILNIINGKFALSERNWYLDFLNCDYDLQLPQVDGKEKKRGWFKQTVAGIALTCKRAWDLVNDWAYIYWLVWFPFELAVGIIRASVGLIYTPIIIGVTFCLGLIYSIPKMYRWIKNSLKSDEEILEDQQNAVQEAEFQRMGEELKLRHFMKKEKEKDEEYLYALMDQKKGGEDYLRELLRLKKLKQKKEGSAEEKKQNVMHRDKEKVQRSKLVQRLLQGSTARIWLSTIVDTVSAIIMCSFALWLISASTYALIGSNPLSTFLDAGAADAGVGAGSMGLVAGLVYFVRKLTDMKLAQADYEQRIHTKMCEEYKNTKRTKLEVFEEYEKEVEFRRARAEWMRLDIIKSKLPQDHLLKNKIDIIQNANAKYFSGNMGILSAFSADEYKNIYKKLSQQRQKIQDAFLEGKAPAERRDICNALANDFDLDKIDVYNDEYRENHRYKKSIGGWINQGLSYFYSTIAVFESGSLLARTLFMAGTVLGILGVGVCIGSGTFPVFAALAIVTATVYTGVALAERYYREKREHKESFLNNMENNISYLRKKGKKLGELDALLTAGTEIDSLIDHTCADPVFGDENVIHPQNDKDIRLNNVVSAGSAENSLNKSGERMQEENIRKFAVNQSFDLADQYANSASATNPASMFYVNAREKDDNRVMDSLCNLDTSNTYDYVY